MLVADGAYQFNQVVLCPIDGESLLRVVAIEGEGGFRAGHNIARTACGDGQGGSDGLSARRGTEVFFR